MGHVLFLFLAKRGNFMLENQIPGASSATSECSSRRARESLSSSALGWKPSSASHPAQSKGHRPLAAWKVPHTCAPSPTPDTRTLQTHQPSPALNLLLPCLYYSSESSGASPAEVTQIHTQSLTLFSALSFSLHSSPFKLVCTLLVSLLFYFCLPPPTKI